MMNNELLEEYMTSKIQEANTYFLKRIGEMIKKIRTLRPTEAHQLVQILKYNGDYEEIVSKISQLTGMPIKEIDRIFAQYSRNDLNFAKKFYDYRNIPFIPFDENIALKRQTEALANITKNAMNNFTRSRALGYSIKELDGTTRFYGLRETYEKVLDEALINVGQGRDTFDNSMTRILKELGGSGLRTLDYASGRSIRLDSMVRMHLKSGLRELHNENQRLLGEEYGADGVEVSVHINPAEDHSEIQGRQFSYSEFNNIQEFGVGNDYTGKKIDITRGVEKISHRPISEYNCYHYTFAIILGVSKPRYSEEELKKIIDDNNKGFEFEGKHYTNYEGTQLMRSIERKVREQKDINIVAKASDNKELDYDSRYKITILSNKYKEISNISGLPTKEKRMKVSGYTGKPVKIEPKIETTSKFVINNKEDLLKKWDEKYKNDNIVVRHIMKADPKLIDEQITQVDNLLNKYDFVKQDINKDYETNALTIQVNTGDIMGENNYARLFGGHYIEFNEKYFKDKDLLINNVKTKISEKWWQDIDVNKYNVYPVTHEYGHLLEYKMIENIEHKHGYKGSLGRGDYFQGDLKIQREILKKVPDMDKYISGYGKSTPRMEWFAETFTKMELGEQNELTIALKEYIDDFMRGNYEYFR